MPSKFRISLFLLFLKFFLLIVIFNVQADDSFDSWLDSYKKFALNEGVSEKTINIVFKDVKYLEKVIKYDRKQPEFFEDTITYVSKRANTNRVNKARKLLTKNSNLFLEIENKFLVEKEILPNQARAATL